MTKIKLLLLVPVLALAACSKSEKDDNIQEYFISGSTQAFYRNAKLNNQSFLEADEAEEFFEDYSFNRVVVIKSKNKVVSYDQKYKEQIPESSRDQKSFTTVKKLGYRVQGKEHEISHKINGYDFIYTFSFKENSDELLELKAFNDHPINVLHYSFNDDKGASFLAKSSTTDTLYAIYYIKKDSAGGNYSRLSANQFSVAHNNTPIRWKSRYHNLNLCGDSAMANRNEVLSAINLWKQAVGEKALEVELGDMPNGAYPPFSDLNANCIYFIQDYLASDNSHVTMGRTHPLYNADTNEMHSAPMFIFLNEIEKFPENQQQLKLETTIVHEMGHFFGLGHPPHDSNTPSIMSYKDDSNQITQYDIQLYNDLYKDVDEVGFFSSWFN